MGYFLVRYTSRVVNYDRRGFIRLATCRWDRVTLHNELVCFNINSTPTLVPCLSFLDIMYSQILMSVHSNNWNNKILKAIISFRENVCFVSLFCIFVQAPRKTFFNFLILRKSSFLKKSFLIFTDDAMVERLYDGNWHVAFGSPVWLVFNNLRPMMRKTLVRS